MARDVLVERGKLGGHVGHAGRLGTPTQPEKDVRNSLVWRHLDFNDLVVALHHDHTASVSRAYAAFDDISFFTTDDRPCHRPGARLQLASEVIEELAGNLRVTRRNRRF